jgi:hypothetical protein
MHNHFSSQHTSSLTIQIIIGVNVPGPQGTIASGVQKISSWATFASLSGICDWPERVEH